MLRGAWVLAFACAMLLLSPAFYERRWRRSAPFVAGFMVLLRNRRFLLPACAPFFGSLFLPLLCLSSVRLVLFSFLYFCHHCLRFRRHFRSPALTAFSFPACTLRSIFVPPFFFFRSFCSTTCYFLVLTFSLVLRHSLTLAFSYLNLRSAALVFGFHLFLCVTGFTFCAPH